MGPRSAVLALLAAAWLAPQAMAQGDSSWRWQRRSGEDSASSERLQRLNPAAFLASEGGCLGATR